MRERQGTDIEHVHAHRENTRVKSMDDEDDDDDESLRHVVYIECMLLVKQWPVSK